MDALAHAEATKYERTWTEVPSYRTTCHSLRLWRERRDLFPAQFASAIDIGCGTGRLIPVLDELGIDVWGVDLVPDVSLDEDVRRQFGSRVWPACLWDFAPRRVFDLGICIDVMEHIPETRVPDVLRGMARYCRQVVFKIANFPAESTGRSLHLTQRGRSWWQGEIIAAMDGSCVYRPHQTGKEDYVLLWQRQSS